MQTKFTHIRRSNTGKTRATKVASSNIYLSAIANAQMKMEKGMFGSFVENERSTCQRQQWATNAQGKRQNKT